MTCYKTQWGLTWSPSPPSSTPIRGVVSPIRGGRAREEASLMRKVHQRAGGRHSGVHQGHVDVSSRVQECFQEVGDLVPGFIQASDLSVQGGRQTLITAAINADENIVWVITCGLKTRPQAEVRRVRTTSWLGRWAAVYNLKRFPSRQSWEFPTR